MQKECDNMTLLDANQMIVRRRPFGSDLRFVGPNGECLGLGRLGFQPFGVGRAKRFALRLFADSAGQDAVLAIHGEAAFNEGASLSVVDANTGEECAGLRLKMLPQISWQITDAQQESLGTVVADYGDAQTAVVQFDDQVVCTVRRSQRFGGFGTDTWEIEFNRSAEEPEHRLAVLAAVLVLMVCAWPGVVVSKNILRTLSLILGACLCSAGVFTTVVVAVISAQGGDPPWAAYAIPGFIALLGVAMMIVRFRT
jgi:hypothetical protein